MRRFLLTFAMLALTAQGAAANALHGVWLREDGGARIRIAPCGDKICATNLWLADTSHGQAAGDRLVMDLSQTADGAFSGTAYDAKRDSTYSMTIRPEPGLLRARGCILARLLCREIVWKANP